MLGDVICEYIEIPQVAMSYMQATLCDELEQTFPFLNLSETRAE